MWFVETIAREKVKEIPLTLCVLATQALLDTALNKLRLHLSQNLISLACSLLGQYLTNDIAVVKWNILTKLMRQGSNLLLENKEAIGFLSYFLSHRVDIFHIIWVVFGCNIVTIYLGAKRTRAKDRCNSSDIHNAIRLRSNAKLLSPWLSKLKYSSPLSLMENTFVYLRIVEIDSIWVEVLLVKLFNVFKCRLLNTFVAPKDMRNSSLHHSQGS